jgi:hypothetical protein
LSNVMSSVKKDLFRSIGDISSAACYTHPCDICASYENSDAQITGSAVTGGKYETPGFWWRSSCVTLA